MSSNDSLTFDSANAVGLPASKSIGARYLAATYFAGTLPADPLFDDSEDLEDIQQALLMIYSDEQPIDYGDTPIDVNASGTALRFVTALCASTPEADYVITGTPRLMERPMDPLIDVLRKAGAVIEAQGGEGKGPYRVRGEALEGGEFNIRGDISSQFISALMLAAPSWKKGMKLNFKTEVRSRPYIEMTAKIMETFDIHVNLTETYVEVEPGRYKDPGDFRPEADWSAASFFYAAACYGCGPVSVEGPLPPQKSMQGDSALADFMIPLGIRSSFVPEGVVIGKTGKSAEYFELNLSANPDLLPALIVPCVLTGTRCRFTGVRTLRLKESDRLDVIKKELAKLGFKVEIEEDAIEWKGDKGEATEEPIDPHDDHRIAMAFSTAAFALGKIRIKNPDVVAKSFVNFWQELPKIGLKCEPQPDDIMMVSKQ